MYVTVLRYPQDIYKTCGRAAALCTGSEDNKRSLKGAMLCGHESVSEHDSFTFEIGGVSRVLLAQLTRHRIASFSVQSQRYCGIGDGFIIPPSVSYDAHLLKEWNDYLDAGIKLYQRSIDRGIPVEDARYITSQGITTTLVMTMDIRELRHFFSLRCCNRAQWEIRDLADAMLAICREHCPTLFNDAGPGCIHGRCPEGKKCCGYPRKELMVDVAAKRTNDH